MEREIFCPPTFFNLDPHSFLGPHLVAEGNWEIRVLRPGAFQVWIDWRGTIQELERLGEDGLFIFKAPDKPTPLDYEIFHVSGLKGKDPYAFTPSIGELDQYLFSKGVHYQLYEVMGGRLISHQGAKGGRFTVWAPLAQSVSLVGDFNHWDGRVNPMRRLGTSGVWEIFIPGLDQGIKYKFEVRSFKGELLIKTDPYALAYEERPRNGAVLVHQQPRGQRGGVTRDKNGPLNIYEVHLGSWRKGTNPFMNYRELAPLLSDYCLEMGFTHVEILPLTEHPLDESWGYQTTGYFAPTSRFGSPEDFRWFVDHLHEKGVGVILDWSPAHFPSDDFGLSRFDGTALYEHEDPRQGWHPHWETCIFNYGRPEVSNFLIASALYWLLEMGVDGLRVDAVASMLYLDYGRDGSNWVPNVHGGKENLEAIEFIKHLNSVIHEKVPEALMIAEESTSFWGVTAPLEQGGLGFDYKWNMGWMNDTLKYFSKDPVYRAHHQGELTFSLLYAFSEKFVLALSHDEVVHGKGSLIGKFPGDTWQKFANARLLFGYMMTHPGKKLLFMGGEIGQWNEWNSRGEIDWFLTDFPIHTGLKNFVKEINHLYLGNKALWANDQSYGGFEWVDFSDHHHSVISFLRKGEGQILLVIHNFTPTYFPHYSIPLANVAKWRSLLCSDEERFGGSGKGGKIVETSSSHLSLDLPPLATSIFEIWF